MGIKHTWFYLFNGPVHYVVQILVVGRLLGFRVDNECPNDVGAVGFIADTKGADDGVKMHGFLVTNETEGNYRNIKFAHVVYVDRLLLCAELKRVVPSALQERVITHLQVVLLKTLSKFFTLEGILATF